MAADALHFRFIVDGENFTSAGEASVEVKEEAASARICARGNPSRFDCDVRRRN